MGKIFDIFGSIAGGILTVLDFLPGIDIDDSLIDLAFSGGDTIRGMNLSGTPGPSLQGKAASNNIGGGGTSGPAADNKMAMPGGPQVYVMVKVDPVTGKTVEEVVTKQYYETNLGKQGKK